MALITLLLMAGEPLGDVQRDAEKALEFVHKARFGLVVDVITAQLMLIRVFRGLSPDFSSFDDEPFDEGRFEQRLEGDSRLAIATCWYWIRKLQARFFVGDYPTALEAGAKARPLLWTSPSFLEVAEYHFYGALARAAHTATRPLPMSGPSNWRRWPPTTSSSRCGSRTVPRTSPNRAALVGAEIARLDGDVVTAEMGYEQAIRSARENGFVHNEALAFETAGQFYRGRGLSVFADAYLREARDRYLRWGADGKVRQLEHRYPQLVEHLALGPAVTLTLRPDQLDLLAVVKASQTISGAVVRESAVVHAPPGGTRGQRRAKGAAGASARWRARAGGRGRRRRSRVAHGRPPRAERAQVNPAIRAADPGTRAPPRRDRGCGPLRPRRVPDAHAPAFGAVPAHSPAGRNGCPDVPRQRAFARRVHARAFAYARAPRAQAAISLENVLLLEREHAGRVEAEAASRRALLLAEATALIASTADDRDVFKELARLCVRSFADWAIIDLVHGDDVVRVAGAHRDATKEPVIRELLQRYPARPGTRAPAKLVLEDGAPRLISSLTLSDAEIRSYCVDEAHAALILQLGTQGVIAVPLTARGARLGALTFGAASPRQFAAADLEFAVELARRAALAIDNARLLHETHRALRLREEFLTVASHELRTPITSLQLTVQSLLHSARRGKVAPDTLERALPRIVRKTRRLEELASDLLDVTRIEQGRLEIRPAEVDLASVVHEVTDRFELELASAHCPLTVNCGGPVLGESGRLATRSSHHQPVVQRRQIRRRAPHSHRNRQTRRGRAIDSHGPRDRHRPRAPVACLRTLRTRCAVGALWWARPWSAHRTPHCAGARRPDSR